jgi:acetyl esterase/lipase
MSSKQYQLFQKKAAEERMISNMPDLSAGPPTLPDDYRAEVPEIPDGYEGGEVFLNGVRGLKLTRPNTRSKCCMMHIHGGGFTIGTAMDTVDLLRHLSQKTQLDCYSVDYRLAPKYRYPAQVDDCVAFYRGLLDLGYERIVVGGESAGGTLTLTLTLSLRDAGLPLPAALWCSSPAVDANYANEELYVHDQFSAVGDAVFATYTLPNADKADPIISPVHADFTGFPPTLVQCGSAESLGASCVRLVSALAKADVDFTFRFGKGMEHTYAMYFGQFPEATAAMRQITDFVNDVLDLDA